MPPIKCTIDVRRDLRVVDVVTKKKIFDYVAVITNMTTPEKRKVEIRNANYNELKEGILKAIEKFF